MSKMERNLDSKAEGARIKLKDPWNVCPLTEKMQCENLENPEQFWNTCLDNYQNCKIYQTEMEKERRKIRE